MNDHETRLAEMLHERAAVARPDDRLGDVLHGAPVRRAWWPAAVAVAAAVLLVVGGPWLTRRDRPTNTIHPATSVTGVWGELPAPPLGPRLLSVSVATNDGWFVWGGRKQWNGDAGDDPEVEGAYYERATGEWRTLPGAPLDVSPGQEIGTGVWTGTEVVVAVGGATPQFAAFDPHAFTWRSIAVPADIVAHWPTRQGVYDSPVMDWIAGQVVAAIPAYSDTQSYSWILTFDPSLPAIESEVPPMPAIPLGVRMVSSDHSLYLVDASVGDCRGTRQVHIYDVAAGTWNSIDLPHDNWVPSIVAWTGTGLLVAGGTDCTSDQGGVRFAAVLDGGSAIWRTAADLPEDQRNVMFAPTATADGLVASLDYDGAPFVYDSGLDRWWVGPPIAVGIADHPATVGGVHLVALGRDLLIWSPQVSGAPDMTLHVTGTVLHLAIPDPSSWADRPVSTSTP